MEKIKYQGSEWEVVHKSIQQGAVLIKMVETTKVITISEYKKLKSKGVKIFDLMYNGQTLVNGHSYSVCKAKENFCKATGNYNFHEFRIIKHV